MSGKIDKTVNVGRFKGGEAQVRTILVGQGFETKTLALRSKDHTNEIWDIVLANGRKVQLVAQNKGDKVSIKEV
ncbi:MAG TPA: hypothetical protein VGK13_04090 [Methanocellaceae archaeon]